jgi:hypothetical protein
MKKMIYLLLLVVLVYGFLWVSLRLRYELQQNSGLQAQVSDLSYQVDSIRRQEGAILDAKTVYSIKNTTVENAHIDWNSPDLIGLENVAFIDDQFKSMNTCSPDLEIDGGSNTVITNNTIFNNSAATNTEIDLLASNDTPWSDLWRNEARVWDNFVYELSLKYPRMLL